MDRLPPELVCEVFSQQRKDVDHFNLARCSSYFWQCAQGRVKRFVENDLQHLRRIQNVARQVGLLTTISPVSVYFNRKALRCAVCNLHPFQSPQDLLCGLHLCQSCHLAFFPKIEVDVLTRNFDIHPWAMAKIKELEKSSTARIRSLPAFREGKANLNLVPWEPLASLATQGFLCLGKVGGFSPVNGWEEIEIYKQRDAWGYSEIQDSLWMGSGPALSRKNLYADLCLVSKLGKFGFDTFGLSATYLDREIWLLRCFHVLYNPRMIDSWVKAEIGHRELAATAREWATPEFWPLRPWRLSIFPVSTACCLTMDYLKTADRAREDRQEFQRYQRFASRIAAMFCAFPDILSDRVSWENCMDAENWVEAERIAKEGSLKWTKGRDRSPWAIELQGGSEGNCHMCVDTELVQAGREILDFKSNDQDAMIIRWREGELASYIKFGWRAGETVP